ncbi:MAG: hypothetical protein WAX69_12460 [Victivallales bacterium]
MELRREFSWSYSRYRCFDFCKTAYHLRYTASWGGWDKFSEENARLVYTLKNLRSVNSWLNQVFRETVRNVFIESQGGNFDFNAVSLKKSALRKLKNDWHDAVAAEWKNDPRKLNLREIYYGKEDPENIFNLSVDRLFDNINCFSQSGVFEEISRLPYHGFNDEKNPVAFFLDGLKIWLSPDLIFSDKKGMNLMNFCCETGIEGDAWPHIAGIGVLYACDKFKMPEEKINARTVFLEDSNAGCLSVYSYANTSELRDTINESALDMLEFENNSISFSRPESDSKCQTCEFRRICLG